MVTTAHPYDGPAGAAPGPAGRGAKGDPTPVPRAVPVLSGPLRTVRRSLPLGQALLLAAMPYGGQRAARRNAWSGMSPEAARNRRDAEDALGQARSRTADGSRLPVR